MGVQRRPPAEEESERRGRCLEDGEKLVLPV